jgi:ABC1 atypical kinase-like domain
MVELQKLCDKVPSYDSKIAFATIERELGRPVDEIFAEITPEPVAAASVSTFTPLSPSVRIRGDLHSTVTISFIVLQSKTSSVKSTKQN